LILCIDNYSFISC